MSPNRLLSEAQLADIRHWAQSLPGAVDGRVPEDLTRLLSHVDAQAEELRRARVRVNHLSQAVMELLDLAENGGVSEYRASVLERARAALVD